MYFRGRHEDGSSGVWSAPVGGGAATMLVAFDDPSVLVVGFAIGSDDIYLTISEYESDIWVMDLSY